MSKESKVLINIPHYPPFKLRSSLIDKDPVIWVQCLESYIRLFIYLNDSNQNNYNNLHLKSQQQLQLFLKVYLHETSEEHNHIFSLGTINPDIRNNTELLKAYVFTFLRNYSLIKMSLSGEAVWNFISIYVKDNASIVRSLVDGSMKSKYNEKKSENISCISIVHKHLHDKIIKGAFSTNDLNTLSTILGQHISSKTINIMGDEGKANDKSINRANSSALLFAEKFVSVEWIELLESVYQGIHNEIAKNIMVTSLISLSVAKIAKLAMNLKILSIDTLKISPLFSSIIISEPFKEIIPGLEQRLQFLKNIKFNDIQGKESNDVPVDMDHINFLIEMFPNLSEGKARTILKENDGDAEKATNILVENPDIIDSLIETPSEQISIAGVGVQESLANEKLLNRFSDSLVLERVKPTPEVENDSKLKAKNWEAALRVLYDSDEDEPDDSYSYDTIAVENSALMEDERKKSTPKPDSGSISQQEKYLFNIYRESSPSVFSKNQRKSPFRAQMKNNTKWTDEQIEGWYRMLEKMPKRLKILEEDYLNSRVVMKKQRKAYRKGDETRNK